MVEISWIRFSTRFFEDEKIKLIQTLPEADTILIIWIKLLIMAGKINDRGAIYLSEAIPYSLKMLSILLEREEKTVEFALKIFKDYKMISINERGIIFINNWANDQNIEGLEKIRKQTRLRVQKYRLLKINGEEILKRDNFICQYCGANTDGIDHLIPAAKIGKEFADDALNMVACCIECNRQKMLKELDAFLNYRLQNDNLRLDLVTDNNAIMSKVKYNGQKFIPIDDIGTDSNVTAEQIVTQQNRIEKDKKKEEKENNNIVQIIEYLNLKAGAFYRKNNNSTNSLIRARLKDYSVEEIKAVINLKVRHWKQDDKMSQYLRPSTLFNATKFENYYNQYKKSLAYKEENERYHQGIEREEEWLAIKKEELSGSGKSSKEIQEGVAKDCFKRKNFECKYKDTKIGHLPFCKYCS